MRRADLSASAELLVITVVCSVVLVLSLLFIISPILESQEMEGPEVINMSHDHDPIYTSPVTKIHSVSKNATFYF